jgi:hypothetical protein
VQIHKIWDFFFIFLPKKSAESRLHFLNPLLHYPLDAVLRIRQGHRRFFHRRHKVRLPPALIQPIAADDVASAVGRIAMDAPVNGTVEVGGPEQFRLDELVRRGLAARKDPREVVADPQARYYGAALSETTLVPGTDARLGETRFEDWLNRPATIAAAR